MLHVTAPNRKTTIKALTDKKSRVDGNSDPEYCRWCPSGYAPGARVCAGYAPGMHRVPGYAPGMCRVCAGCPGMRQVCPGMRWVCAGCPGMRRVCAGYAPGMRRVCAGYARGAQACAGCPGMHWVCAGRPGMRQVCAGCPPPTPPVFILTPCKGLPRQCLSLLRIKGEKPVCFKLGFFQNPLRPIKEKPVCFKLGFRTRSYGHPFRGKGRWESADGQNSCVRVSRVLAKSTLL